MINVIGIRSGCSLAFRESCDLRYLFEIINLIEIFGVLISESAVSV